MDPIRPGRTGNLDLRPDEARRMNDEHPAFPQGSADRPVDRLQRTIHLLRSPGGCPWDRKQTLTDAARFLLDEAGELLDAVLAGDPDHVREELADLLFMVCFCVEILGETRPLNLDDVARDGGEKLVRRHPHVFGDARARDTGESQQRWNEMKDQEKRERGVDPARQSLLRELPSSTAPLHQAYAYQNSAADVGFDWPDLAGVWEKLDEEREELLEAAAGGDLAAVTHEVGDLLFAVVNLSRRLGVQPDLALRQANHRFRDRFQQVEAAFGNDPERLRGAPLADLETAWVAAKVRERERGEGGAQRPR
ncbi:MAG: nucleoside triphosphate pyrophosphohydrolase [Candidatus Krumholzibacteriia bacterium]